SIKTVFLTILSLLLSPSLFAFCLQECERGSAGRKGPSAIGSVGSIGWQSNDNRLRSHNFGNNSTAILGDMNIRVGHERIEINGMRDSQNSMIDASITSIVNLGGSQ
ncbi:MAG: hypothetical protein HYW02_06430, partial [Deltaproteobacteria bacterium]|nr:hypothetical protein [Deltaproteobacteria bacterium]